MGLADDASLKAIACHAVRYAAGDNAMGRLA